MNKLMTAAAIGLMSAGLAVSAVAAQASALKVGVVDYMSVFQAVPQGNAKLEALQSSMKPKVAKLKSDQGALAAAVKKLERNAPTLSKSDRKAQEEKLAAKQARFQKEVMALRGQEMKKEHMAAKTFESDLKSAISVVAKKDGYSMVISKQAAPYVVSSLNLSSDVVTQMKKMA